MSDQTPTRGRVRRVAHITREMVRADRRTIYVFGDNLEGRGFGGQAAAMHGEPNAMGVPTKWRSERALSSYFEDRAWRDPRVSTAIVEAFRRIKAALEAGRDVVIPTDGLGTGLAELPSRAPKLHARIGRAIARLEGEYAHA